MAIFNGYVSLPYHNHYLSAARGTSREVKSIDPADIGPVIVAGLKEENCAWAKNACSFEENVDFDQRFVGVSVF